MKKQRLKDSGLHAWPPVHQQGDMYRLSAKLLKPRRLVLLNDFLLTPLRFLWKVALIALLVDAGLSFFLEIPLNHYWSLYHRTFFITAVVLLPLLYLLEQHFRYPLLRVLFGKSVKILVTKEMIKIGRKRYERDTGLRLSLQPIQYDGYPFYNDSSWLSLVIHDRREIKLLELYEPELCKRLLANANQMIEMSEEGLEAA